MSRLKAFIRGRIAPRSRGQRGVALLMVLLMLALVGSVVAEFQYASEVDLRLAINARDELQAEYNALSALRLRAVVLRNARKTDQVLKGLAGVLGMDANAMPSIGQMLDSLPIECGLLSTVFRAAGQEFGDADAGEGELDSDLDSGGFFPGDCIATSQSEHSKISVNFSGGTSRQAMERVAPLVGMLSNPKLERHFEEDDANGTHADNPEELVFAIVDWVDSNGDQSPNNIGDEDRFYDLLDDSYKAKNAPFDSLAELQMVHGIDDELYELLKDNVTIYHDSTKIELPTASTEQIMMSLFALLKPAQGIEPAMIAALGLLFDEIATLKAGFGALNKATLKAGLMNSGLANFLDMAQFDNRFSDSTTTAWYTIEAQGQVGNVNRKIRAVYQAMEGNYYYVRME